MPEALTHASGGCSMVQAGRHVMQHEGKGAAVSAGLLAWLQCGGQGERLPAVRLHLQACSASV